MGRRRRRRGGFFRRIGRAFSRVGRAIGGAVKGVLSIPGKVIGGVAKAVTQPFRRRRGGSSTPAPPPPSATPQPSSTGTSLANTSRARSNLRSDPVFIKAGEKRSAVPPSTIQLIGKDMDDALEVFGDLDKEYGAFEKPPLNKVLNLDADVTWGYKDFPAVFLDWGEYTEQDEKDRVQYYKIMEWIPARDGDENVDAPRSNVLKPMDWYNKFVVTSKDRENDKTSDRKPKRRRRRSESNPKKPSKFRFSKWNNVMHGGRFGEGRIIRGRNESMSSYRKRVSKIRRAGKRRKVMERRGFRYNYKTGMYDKMRDSRRSKRNKRKDRSAKSVIGRLFRRRRRRRRGKRRGRKR